MLISTADSIVLPWSVWSSKSCKHISYQRFRNCWCFWFDIAYAIGHSVKQCIPLRNTCFLIPLKEVAQQCLQILSNGALRYTVPLLLLNISYTHFQHPTGLWTSRIVVWGLIYSEMSTRCTIMSFFKYFVYSIPGYQQLLLFSFYLPIPTICSKIVSQQWVNSIELQCFKNWTTFRNVLKIGSVQIIFVPGEKVSEIRISFLIFFQIDGCTVLITVLSTVSWPSCVSILLQCLHFSVQGCLEWSSAFLWFLSVICWTEQLYCCNFSIYRASCPSWFFRFRSHCKGAWSVLIMKFRP